MPLFDSTDLALQAAMHGTQLRQQAIAQNIANANTPNYHRVDVDFSASLAAAMNGVAGVEPTVRRDLGAAVQQDGNSVDMDVEATAQATNGLTYEALVQVQKARIDILESAMGVR